MVGNEVRHIVGESLSWGSPVSTSEGIPLPKAD